MKTSRAALFALSIPLLVVAVGTPAQATDDWYPDAARIVDIPSRLITEELQEDLGGLEALGLQTGDVVPLKWLPRKGSECRGFYSKPGGGAICPYLALDSGLHPVSEEHPWLSPALASSLDGREYPVFDAGFVEYSIRGYLGSRVFNDEPSRRPDTVDIIWEGTLLAASDERYRDSEGEPYRRVAMGLMDLWVAASDLREPKPVREGRLSRKAASELQGLGGVEATVVPTPDAMPLGLTPNDRVEPELSEPEPRGTLPLVALGAFAVLFLSLAASTIRNLLARRPQ